MKQHLSIRPTLVVLLVLWGTWRDHRHKELHQQTLHQVLAAELGGGVVMGGMGGGDQDFEGVSMLCVSSVHAVLIRGLLRRR